jgi:hypothetical protein
MMRKDAAGDETGAGALADKKVCHARLAFEEALTP